jgi:hypothetical protein
MDRIRVDLQSCFCYYLVLNQTEVFYKLSLIDIVGRLINNQRTLLEKELQEKASDPVIFKRRFRMLSQLADYESQIYKKIYNFDTEDFNDYKQIVYLINNEIQNVTDRSG